jgi:nicotinate phosphoribosyltransferase
VPAPALSVDLYELTMGESYLAEGMADRPATFSLFFRGLPHGWGYGLAAGLDAALDYLGRLVFSADDVSYLQSTGLFRTPFLDRLRRFRFSGDVRAIPEGTLVFPNEPLLEVTAPILEAQIVETMMVNAIHLHTLIASKAARCVDAAKGATLVDFALRRAHGSEAGLAVARSSYIAGFDATSNVEAGRRHSIPIAGTMAHSYVEAFPSEVEAFRAFAESFPDGSTLLVDTYDTIEGTRLAVVVGRELAARGHRLRGIRLDSGDLAALSRGGRALLDEGDLSDAVVFASGGLDERDVADLLAVGAPIDGFGIGSKLGVSADAPFLDLVYKLVDLDGTPTRKLSSGKATLPGRKQAWRVSDRDRFVYDVLGLADALPPEQGEPLLVEVMKDGQRVHAEPLDVIRARARAQREALPAEHRTLDATPYQVRIDSALVTLDARLAQPR